MTYLDLNKQKRGAEVLPGLPRVPMEYLGRSKHWRATYSSHFLFTHRTYLQLEHLITPVLQSTNSSYNHTLSCWTFLKAQHLGHIWCKQMFCPLAWPRATLDYRSHYVLNILYLKREEAQSIHLLLPWDRERTQNRPRWQLLSKDPTRKDVRIRK